jgi:hypothetical protein
MALIEDRPNDRDRPTCSSSFSRFVMLLIDERPVDVAIALAIAEHRYDLGAAHHLAGYPPLSPQPARAASSASRRCPRAGSTARSRRPERHLTWVWHQMDGPPITVGRQFTAASSALNKAVRDRSRQGHHALPRQVRHGPLGGRRADQRSGRYRSAGVDA